MRYGAALHRLQALQAVDDPDQWHAEGMGGGGGGQRIADVVLAQQVELDARLAGQTAQGEADAAARIAGNVAGMEVGGGIAQAEAQHLAAGDAGLPDIEGRIVAIEYRDAIGIQAFEDFALGLDDLVLSAELADMGGSGIGDDRHLRPGQTHGVGDLADARGAELDHRAAVIGADLQQGQRRAEVVVQVAAGGQHRATGAQDAGEHLLDRGLTAGAGNGHDWLVERGTVQRTELTQGQAAISDEQLRQVDIGHFTLDQGSHCAFGFHIRQVVMAIETRAGQGDEQLPGADTAAIDADAGERGVATDVLTLQCCGQLAE
ncbi:hypothetical protein D9M71_360830 [compost metagenome]